MPNTKQAYIAGVDVERPAWPIPRGQSAWAEGILIRYTLTELETEGVQSRGPGHLLPADRSVYRRLGRCASDDCKVICQPYQIHRGAPISRGRSKSKRLPDHHDRTRVRCGAGAVRAGDRPTCGGGSVDATKREHCCAHRAGYNAEPIMTTATGLLNHSAKSVTPGQDRQRELGQFLTPPSVADFMTSLFEARWKELDLLDAGAGKGALSAALVKRLCSLPQKPERIFVTAYELDETLIESLSATLRACQRECERANISFSAKVINEDFIAAAVPMVRDDLFASRGTRFNAAIANPPYRKIRSDSPTRLLLRSAGIEATNLYAGFVSLITRLLSNRGELVAITPRSFCNGPYFKPFRTHFLETMSLRRLHVFESRSTAFSCDDVLQENVIVHATKEMKKPKHVIVSMSSGASGGAIIEPRCCLRGSRIPRRCAAVYPYCGKRWAKRRASGTRTAFNVPC